MGPRIFAIPALRAPVVAVIRRGPSGWSHVGRWDVERDTYEPGSWLHGVIYPQRCDLSPDGRWFAYFALKSASRWRAGWTYVAISRLPWLTALAAWGTQGTWSRGLHFTETPGQSDLADPDEGDVGPLRRQFGLEVTAAASFAVERRRGWSETPDTPPRATDRDWWDETRAPRITMEKARPDPHPRRRESPGTRSEQPRLLARGRFAAFRDSRPTAGPAWYGLAGAGADPIELVDVQWAGDRRGRLLVATTAGSLEARLPPFDTSAASWRCDLGAMTPEPVAPPAEASAWGR